MCVFEDYYIEQIVATGVSPPSAEVVGKKFPLEGIADTVIDRCSKNK